MCEFTITCGNCGSVNCRVELEFWDDGDYLSYHLICDDCGETGT